jgi:type 1 glutamine amidotransferase
VTAATRALVLAGGTPPYTDPWHPFAETSAALARIAEELGFEVEVATDVAARLADLSGVNLLIADVPSPTHPLDAMQLEAAAAGLREFLARPGGVFALHVSVTTLLGLPPWSEVMGAKWVQGTTMHPPLGRWSVTSAAGGSLSGGGGDFELTDELYTYLEFDGDREDVLTHVYDGTTHPVLWLREVGPTRVVADALGHGAESFDSVDHVAIIRAALLWATAQPVPNQ